MNPDKTYYYDAQVDANVYFDSGKGAYARNLDSYAYLMPLVPTVKEGIESLHLHLDKGYRPIECVFPFCSR
jgi:hypothetical protein